jgi:hypothetical protein
VGELFEECDVVRHQSLDQYFNRATATEDWHIIVRVRASAESQHGRKARTLIPRQDMIVSSFSETCPSLLYSKGSYFSKPKYWRGESANFRLIQA